MPLQSLPDSSNTILPTEPEAVKLEPLKTPDDGQERSYGLFDTLDGAIPSLASLEVSSAPPKISQGLRLPSFHLLGIAARHPEQQILDLDDPAADIGAGSPILTDPSELRDASSNEALPKAFSPRPQTPPKSGSESGRDGPKDIFRDPLHQHVATITPPEESDAIDWSARATVHLADVESPTDAPEGRNTVVTPATRMSHNGLGPAQITTGQILSNPQSIQEVDEWLISAVENYSKSDTSKQLLATLTNTQTS